MKYIQCYLFLIFSFFILFISCEKIETENLENEIVNLENEFKVSVFYDTGNKRNVDIGSQVFIYYDKDQQDLIGLEYLENGIFSNQGTLISHNLRFDIDESGFVMIDTKYLKDHEFLVISESCHFRARLVDTYFTSLARKAKHLN